MADDSNVLSLASARQRSRDKGPAPSGEGMASFEQRREAAREVLKARGRLLMAEQRHRVAFLRHRLERERRRSAAWCCLGYVVGSAVTIGFSLLGYF